MTTSDANPDPLDECLKNARWPEPTATVLTRLEARWESLARERARSRRWLVRWTLAATILLAVGMAWGGWLLLRPGQPEIVPPIPKITPPRLAKKPDKESTPTTESLVRPPTRFEAVAFNIMVHHQRQARVNRRPEPLLEVLKQALNLPESNVAELCQPLKTHRVAYEHWILSRLDTWNPEEQAAALKILREIGSPRAIPVLDRLSQEPAFAKLAWPVALDLAPIHLLEKWAKTAAPANRKDAVRELLHRPDDPNALREYLQLVAHPASRTLALETIQTEAEPPVEALFAALEKGSTKEERHTAGLVLGRIATPDITRQLLAIAKQQDFPPEVMIAILNSSDEEAAEFLDRAKHIPQARTAVQLACLEWELISYTSTLLKPSEIHQ